MIYSHKTLTALIIDIVESESCSTIELPLLMQGHTLHITALEYTNGKDDNVIYGIGFVHKINSLETDTSYLYEYPKRGTNVRVQVEKAVDQYFNMLYAMGSNKADVIKNQYVDLSTNVTMDWNNPPTGRSSQLTEEDILQEFMDPTPNRNILGKKQYSLSMAEFNELMELLKH